MEMLFHHICTAMLIIGYLVPNGHVWGTAYCVLHDWSEVFMYMARIAQATPYSLVAFISLFGMYLSWIWTRLIVLPYSIWLVSTNYCSLQAEKANSIYEVSFVKSMLFVLSAMDFLYIYWFILLSQMIANYIFQGKVDDLQQKVPGEDKKKKD